MKNALDWIKSNPISAASCVIAFLGVLVFAYVLFMKAPSFRARVVAENGKQANDLNALMRASVELPNPDPNDAPIEITNLVINQQVIDYVQNVYDTVGRQSAQIKGTSLDINRRQHENFTFVGRRVFGNDSTPGAADIVAATEAYRNSFLAMFKDGFASLNMPRIAVGLPPTLAEVTENLDRVVYEYIDSVGAESTGDLTQAQAEELYQLQQVAVMEILKGRAESISLYADVLPLVREAAEPGSAGAPGGISSSGQPATSGFAEYGPEYPFTIADWAYAAEQPALDELWEGQVQIWIIRDIMTAIMRTNSTQVPNADGTVTYQPNNVIAAPVKRLISLEVVDGYVGLHSGGGINTVAGSGSGGAGGGAGLGGAGLGGALGAPGGRGAMPGGRGGMPAAGGRGGLQGGRGGMPTGGSEDDGLGGGLGATPGAVEEQEVSTVYDTPSLATLPNEKQAIIDSFHFGPTGRFSNSVFDVRHARLTIHVAWESLPEFFEQLRLTNFMTVIDMQFRDVDEYDALASGYLYGVSDVVEVDMVIETLWFRGWTVPLMPQMVRKALAVPDDQP